METVNLNQLPALVKRQIPTAQLPAIYTETKRQLASCVDILVVKDYHDKAMGLAEWARIAKEPDMEEHALRIRLHAKVRMGQLLNEIKPKALGYLKGMGPGAEAAALAAGLSKSACVVAKRLASAPAKLLAKLETTPPKRALSDKWACETLPLKPGHRPLATSRRLKSGDNYHRLTYQGKVGVITSMASHARRTAPALACKVTKEEAAKLRPILIEISEWCDAVEHYLPKEKKK